MPLKNHFKINHHMVNWGSMSELLPVSYTEVAPGETVTGSVETNVHSAPTNRNVQNQCYLDGFSFYIPYRLLWEEWPHFITQDGESYTFPYVTNLFQQNFEGRFTLASGGSGTAADRNTVWRRRAYNLVYNSFFAKGPNNHVAIDSQGLKLGLQRPSTFEVATTTGFVEETIDTSGATLGIDDIREAFTKDAYQKTRAFYGERYTDYLATSGVQSSWSIEDDPEPRGMVHTDWKYRNVNATAEGTDFDPGYSAGYFNSTIKIPIKRTFCPEHGLIATFICARTDPVLDTPALPPHMAKDQWDHYWTPELAARKAQLWPDSLNSDPATVTYDDIERPAWAEYRMGTNENMEASFTPSPGLTMATLAPAVSESYDPSTELAYTFVTGLPLNAHYQATARVRISKNSPIPAPGQQPPIR